MSDKFFILRNITEFVNDFSDIGKIKYRKKCDVQIMISCRLQKVETEHRNIFMCGREMIMVSLYNYPMIINRIYKATNILVHSLNL